MPSILVMSPNALCQEQQEVNPQLNRDAKCEFLIEDTCEIKKVNCYTKTLSIYL